MNRFFLFLTLALLSQIVYSQNITGTVTDKSTNETLIAATIALTNKSDGKTDYTTTDSYGKYKFQKVKNGEYTIKVSYVGYKNYNKNIKVSSAKDILLNISMDEDSKMLKQVSVNGSAIRAKQKGDSIMYNADAFKVLKGSTAEELLSKMPGVVVEGGKIQAQGENVQKVLVDGKEFFGGDVNIALKNLPSDIISGIEIFDKKSEQAQFSGFDDGEEIKTINIVTKSSSNSKVFGDLYAGYGTDNRYRAGGNINLFGKERRISILGMSNNINQQNFSQEDLAGVMSSSQNKGGGRGYNRGNSFMVNNLSGITSTNGIGINFEDRWADKINFVGSYFLNQSNNINQQIIDRTFFDSDISGIKYYETNDSKKTNWNHRLNMKMDYEINKNNSFMINPRISFQKNTNNTLFDGENKTENSVINSIENNNTSQITSYNIGGDMIYRHRFEAPGRTMSVFFGGNLLNNTSDSYFDYKNINENIIDRYAKHKDNKQKNYSLRGSLMFTESIMRNLQLSTQYRVSLSKSNSDLSVYDKANISDLAEQLDESESNKYQSDYLTHSGGLGLRYRKGQFNLMGGLDVQLSSLFGDQDYPTSSITKKKFTSLHPNMMMRYNVDEANAFHFRYRSRAFAPSINNLQNTVNDSNPLFISVGNPNLNQEIIHFMHLRYTLTTKSGNTFIALAGVTFKQNHVSDSTKILTTDTQLENGNIAKKGTQITTPTNMSGYYSLQSMLTFGFPISLIRSNINMSISASYANTPTIFNDIKSFTRDINIIPKVIIGSNISEDLDFTVSYSANINRILNSVSENTRNNNYVYHLLGAKLGWTFWKGFTLRSTFTYTGYQGLMDNPQYFMWNASIGKKFLKNNQAEIKLEAFDILKQNNSFSHVTGSNYYDYITGNVINPYVMLSFTYHIR